ncbi:hypothetical protein [Frigoribacterium sp. CFBP9030]|uniref:hypothetical protein n=1 Tax=Frigoribacterium sp. CFBP9030 TaxID=3096537 RepID=UPI002A6A555C|nr:hypothetical protein [Frigoribacterium sp. CFBP9030]MDY0891988.1 hypothetical protein [Frigoribacterium sp. CFBP9030]
MRRTIRRLLTGGVVAALLAGGMTLPASAAPAPTSFSSPLVFQNPTGGYIAYSPGPPVGDIEMRSFRATTHATYSQAAGSAVSVSLPDPGAGDAIVKLAGGECLTTLDGAGPGRTLVASKAYCGGYGYTWSVTRDGRVISFFGSTGMGPTQPAQTGYWPFTGLRPLLSAGGYPLGGSRFEADPLVVRVDRVNDIARTAVLSGTATKNAQVRAQGRTTTADPTTGIWSLDVRDLAVGANNIDVIQRVGGVDRDTQTARIDIVDGGRVVPAPVSSVELARGGETEVPFIVSNRAARANMTGVVELTAPEGSTFTPGQTRVTAGVNTAGEGSAWTPLPRLDLTNGRVGDGGRTMTFDLASGSGTLAAGQYYRYGLSVTTPASSAPLESSMSYVYRGDSSAGDYRAAGSTATTVVGSADIDTRVGASTPGGTTDWGRSDVQATEVQGAMTLTAPESTRFADAEARRTSDDTARDDHRVAYSNDRRTVTIDGPTDGSALWGSAHQYAAFRLTLDADSEPGAVLTGGEVAVRGAGGATLAEGAFQVAVDEAVPTLTAEITLLDDVTRPATIGGVGDDGGTVTVREGDAVLGEARVVDGRWSLEIPVSIGPGRHTLTASQSVDGRPFGSVEAALDLGAAVDVVEPANGKIVPGRTTVRGTGAPRAEITVTAAGSTVDTTVTADGAWEARVEIRPGHTAVAVTASQHARGDIVTTDTAQVVPDAPQELREVVVTEPSSHFYTPLEGTTVEGTATPYATVDIRVQWGFTIATVEADVDGRWAFDRAFGPSARYELTATQTLVDGRTSSSPVFELYADGSFVPVVVTSHEDGGTYVPGSVTFTGRATQGAYIEARNQYDRLLFSTRASQVAGVWTASTGLGPVATYEITVTQKAPDGTTGQTRLTLSPDLPFRDLAVTSHVDGETYRPGPVLFTGTGTPTGRVVATNQFGVVVGETTIATDGSWSFRRDLGPDADYDLTFTQRFRDEEDSVRLRLLAPVWQPLAMTSPSIGDRYTPGEPTEFTGRATPFSTITATTALGGTLFSVETGADGVWRSTRVYGPDNVYRIDIAQVARNGRTDSLDTFVWAPDLPWAPLAVTSHVSGETYRPGEIELRGTGAPGAVVEITNQWGTLMGRPEVGGDGTWSMRRTLGPTADYVLRLVMTKDGRQDEIAGFELRSPRFSDIELTAPSPGEGYIEGRDYTMTGRATPFATIRATTSLGNPLFETTADRDGRWAHTRRFGPTHVYVIDLTQETRAGETGGYPRFTFAPADEAGAS